MESKPEPFLEFKNVSLQFGKTWALRNISLALYPGECRIIFGAAGSGKTTLLKAVIGLVPVDEGEVYLFGEPVTKKHETELFGPRGHVGFLFQEGGLFDSLTIGENVEYPLLNRQLAGEMQSASQDGGRNPEQRIREALRFVELEQTIGQFPSEVSGGMRRRVGIARAIVTEPPLVLYDSPTAGLDPITANTIMAVVAKERDVRNSASLIVTHRYQDGEIMANFHYDADRQELEFVENPQESCVACGRTRFIVMKEGEIVFFGTRQELEASQDAYVRRFVRREN